MPFPSALTTQNYEDLRGTSTVNPTYRAQEFAVFLPNTVIFAARVNGAPTGKSYAQVTFDTVTTGAYTDIVAGQAVWIGSDSNIRNATFYGRARLNNSGNVATSTILYINETSSVIADNAYIWVTDDYPPFDRLARQVGSTQRKDYDLTYQLTPPIIYNLQTGYAGIVNNSDVYSQAFAPLALAITSGATISSWLWTVPSGMTITSGSTTTQNITASFDSGFNGYVTVRVTDSNSKQGYFHIWVVAVAQDYSNVVTLSAQGTALQANESGWSGSIAAFAGVEDLLDNTAVMVFDVERYNGTKTNILSNVKFTGRIRTENDTTRADYSNGLLRGVSFELEGLEAQISRIEHLPFTLRSKASPTAWDELTNLTIWRALAYTLFWHSTVLTTHSLSFDSTDNTFAYPLLPTQGGNIASVIQDLAVSINAELQSAATGECQIVRNALYLSTGQRTALTTVANFTTADGFAFGLSIQEADNTGKVQASGGFYNTLTGKVTPFLSLAPGVAQDIGEGVTSFTRQVLVANSTLANAQSELNTRTGNHYAIVRREQPVLTVSMRGGYNFLTPTINQWYTWTLPDNFTRGARGYTSATRWQCISVSIAQSNDVGTKDITATFREESQGTAGQTVQFPPPGTIQPGLPIISTISNYPSLPTLPSLILPDDPTIDDQPPYLPPTIVSDGNTVWIGSSSQCWLTRNCFQTSSPQWIEKTPDNLLGDLQAIAWVGNGSVGGYALSNDGTDSRFHYTADLFANPPTWVDTDLTGKTYTVIRVSSTTGAVYVEGVTTSAGDNCDLDNWYASEGTITSRTSSSITMSPDVVLGTYIVELRSPGIDVCCIADAYHDTSGVSPVIQWDLCAEAYPGSFADGHSLNHVGLFPATQCINALRYYGFLGGAFTEVTFDFTTDGGCGDPANVPHTFIAYSSNFGSTFAAPEEITTSLSADVGVDTERVGDVSLIGALGQVQISTTAGGTYSDYGDPFPTDGAPNCLWIPRYQFGSTTSSNAGSTPQYVAASEALTGMSSDISIWRVTSSGTVFTDITPSVSGDPGTIVSVNALAMGYKSGKKMAAIFDFAGTRKLQTSLNDGTSWTNRGNVDATAPYVRYRTSDTLMIQLFIANGAGGLLVSANHGATLLSKVVPTSDDILMVEAF